MADEADIANDYIDYAVTRALKGRKDLSPSLDAGSKICVECEENIPEPRRKLGFVLCVECAEEKERRKSLFADY